MSTTDSSPVCVVIKAANGALGDFRVNGTTPQWTVAQLKNYLYRHYPTHPPVPSQKLIYHGQLLLDSQKLSEVLMLLQDNNNQVVIHLVAYERSVSLPVFSTQLSSTNSLPPVSESGPEEEQGEEEEEEEEEERGRDEGAEMGGSGDRDTDSLTNSGREPPSVAPPPPPDHTPSFWPQYRHSQQHVPRDPMFQNFPMFPTAGGYPYPHPQFYMPPYALANPAQLQQWYSMYYNRPGDAGGEEGEGEDIDLPNLPDQQDNLDIDQDNVPLNAGGLMMGEPQLQAQRDLVDYSYMFLMAMFLVCVAYITNSFGRLVLFLAGVLFMLLNQAGWFALQRRQPIPGDDLPDPLARYQARQVRQGGTDTGGGGSNSEGQEETDGDGDGEQQAARFEDEDQVQGAGRAGGLSSENQENQASPSPPPPPGLLATVFTFVTTFFTSLIPQQQPEPQLN